jgi:hypothetical protein
MDVHHATAPYVLGASGLGFGDSELAPQRLEKMESGLRNGAGTQDPIWDFRSVPR